MAGHNWLGLLQPKDASKPAQPGGCAVCHAGLGLKPSPVGKLTDLDYNNIDCLVCHAPDYRRTVVKEGEGFKLAPAPGVNILKAAQQVEEPTSEMCLRCHLAVGGGPNHKHGVTPTSKESDVHVAKGMQCVTCHTTKQHKVAGGSDLKAQELIGVTADCSNCHTNKPHKVAQADYLNAHVNRVACQTCHIPAIARDPKFPTIAARDWTKPVLNEQTGLYGPTNTFVSNMKPEYRWWNRIMEVPPEPVGSINDPKSKIMPWKLTKYTVIVDKATDQAVYIKAGTYAGTGDPGAAAKKGAEDAKQPYSGEWKAGTESAAFAVNHQVAPRAGALKCDDCHTPNGVLDFKALGYTADRLEQLTRAR